MATKTELLERSNALSEDTFKGKSGRKNKAQWIREEIINNPDILDAESKVISLEADEDTPEMNKEKRKRKRKQDMETESIDLDDMLEAVFKKVILNDPKMANDMKDKVQALYNKNLKS